MRETIGFPRFLATAIVGCCCFMPLSGCVAEAREGFAIYLTRDNVPPAQMEALSHVEIADNPIVSMDDVVSYDQATHEMELTQQAYQRIVELEVPVSGTSFIVCVDGLPAYRGAFWTPVSSLSFDGVTIWKPLSPTDPTSIQLQLGYPSAEAYEGEDQRNAPGVLCALQEAGKLQSRSEASTCPLPHSMKGYELYSWQEDVNWHFTLVSGTNRSKTIAEIVAPVYTVTNDGWVQLHATGVEEIEAALNRLPADECVYWLSAPITGSDASSFSLPPQSMVDEIVRHAVACGLDLHVVEG